MVPKLRPEARDDRATVEAGKPGRIEVLANDIGVTNDGSTPALRVDEQPSCGTTEVDGRAVIYRGGPECVGADVSFKYSVRLLGDSIAATVSVTVTAATFSCDTPGLELPAVRLEGGQFVKSNAPADLLDLLGLLDDQTFTVPSFCMTLDPVPAEAVDVYFNNMSPQERDEKFPETQLQGGAPSATDASARTSQRMAVAFARRSSDRSGRAVRLPSLNEYVAVAWELYKKAPNSPEAVAFTVGLRTGTLQWTSTPCGAAGLFWTIGPDVNGRMSKLCYQQSRLDRTGFRLAIK